MNTNGHESKETLGGNRLGIMAGLGGGSNGSMGPGLAALLRLGFTTAALRRRICGDGEWHGAHGWGWDGPSALMIFGVGT